ncbi:MAG: Mut7-C ubiquitin [Firmicutes bacterium]|nr:Mut7-C ubiquitin [Bacillota bacterium]
MMKITIRAYGLLPERIGTKEWLEMHVGEGITTQNLLDQLGLDTECVMNIVKDGEICPWDYLIQENDKLQLLPFICAG